ncbi:hypothetical protein ALC57_00731 [Trachymyrmex cornetzi]|uniref:Uncharacterized protein n=1 Tax=Trachymyrmex cornetzi TaxID=471704 RepID=A0A151JR29_9HYME|nr:hypothetical protein ALC57_00731 [Trachymyrmex cornetzi]
MPKHTSRPFTDPTDPDIIGLFSVAELYSKFLGVKFHSEKSDSCASPARVNFTSLLQECLLPHRALHCHSNLGRRKREDGKTIYLGELYRSSSPDNSGTAGSDSPLGFLRGVGERACTAATPCSVKPLLTLHFTFRILIVPRKFIRRNDTF